MEVSHEWIISERDCEHLRGAHRSPLFVPHRIVPILPVLFHAYLAAW